MLARRAAGAGRPDRAHPRRAPPRASRRWRSHRGRRDRALAVAAARLLRLRAVHEACTAGGSAAPRWPRSWCSSPLFPRSVRFCVRAAVSRFERIRPPEQAELPGGAALARLARADRVGRRALETDFDVAGLHELLTHVVDETAAICGRHRHASSSGTLRAPRPSCRPSDPVRPRKCPTSSRCPSKASSRPPSTSAACTQGEVPPDGWGIGYYPGGEPVGGRAQGAGAAAAARSAASSSRPGSTSSPRSSCCTSAAPPGAPSRDANTQPFLRAWGRRDWLFGHAGSLATGLELRAGAPFEPVGSTDTELIFCELMNRFAERGWRASARPTRGAAASWLGALNEQRQPHLRAHRRARPGGLRRPRVGGGIWLWEVAAALRPARLRRRRPLVDLGKRGAKSRKGVVVSSDPLAVNGEEQRVAGRSRPATWCCSARGRSREVRAPGSSRRATRRCPASAAPADAAPGPRRAAARYRRDPPHRLPLRQAGRAQPARLPLLPVSRPAPAAHLATS